MKITKTSPLTGRETTMEIDVTEEQLNNWSNKKMLIQIAMPNLTPDEREFIMTGFTSADFEAMDDEFMEEIDSIK